MAHRFLRSLLVTVILGNAALAADTPAVPNQAQSGTFQISFTDRSPLTATKKELARRFTPAPDYDLSKAEFTLHVPPSYQTASEPYGILFLTTFGESEPPPTWLSTLDKHRLIFVTHAKFFKGPLPAQASLAADVIHNLRQTYRVDERRVYVAGDVNAEAAAFYFPEVFMAGIFFGPIGHCRDIILNGQQAYDAYLPAPQGIAAGRTKSRRYAICDVDDGSRGTHTHGHFMADAFRRDLTPDVQLIRISHADTQYSRMTTHWLEQALADFDTHLPVPLATVKQSRAARPAAAVTPVPTAKTPAPPTTPAIAEPQRLLSLAKTYIANHAYAAARTRLNTILTKHPTDPAAAEASTLLNEIRDK